MTDTPKPLTTYTKEEILKSYDAAIEVFQKQIAELQTGLNLLLKYRKEHE